MFLKSLFLSQCLSFKWERRDEDESRSIEKLLKELIVNYLKIILANRFPLIWEVIWLALGSWLVSVAVIESSRSDRSVIEESRQM